MCGIAGFYGRKGKSISASKICEMLASMKPRGPEGTSWGGLSLNGEYNWSREGQEKNDHPFSFVMGCSRLALNDPTDRGLQPLLSSDKRILVSLNGEIFNFIELRSELETLGFTFRTETDTEVLANGYAAWGKDLFPKLNGQFAIAFYEFSTGELTLVRDRVGITPLYFAQLEDGFSFGSEIKALLKIPGINREVNKERLSAIIGLPYKMHRQKPTSLFKNINQVAPGSYLTIERDLKITQGKYWDIRDYACTNEMSFSQAREELRSLLIDSVRLRLRTDRKLSFIVSGGIDSSLVVGVASREYGVEPETWSLDIPDARFNENDEIREVLDFNSVKSNFIPVTPSVLLDHLPWLFERADEPLATPNGILHHIMAKRINSAGYKVVLNGVGGDEGLFGYHDHFLYYLHDLKRTDPKKFKSELLIWSKRQERPLELFERFEEFLSSDQWRVSPDFLARSQGFDYRKLLSGDVSESNLPVSTVFGDTVPNSMNKQIADLTYLTVPHSIVMDDGCYLSHSVEARQPFLDHRILEFGISMPLKFKFHKGYGKYLLRSAVKGFIPDTRRRDVRKTGLNLPIDVWMRNEMRDWLHDTLFMSDNKLFNYTQQDVVKELFKSHCSGEANHSLKLWDLISVSNWLNRD